MRKAGDGGNRYDAPPPPGDHTGDCRGCEHKDGRWLDIPWIPGGISPDELPRVFREATILRFDPLCGATFAALS
jgi:hypothetical protein